MSVHRSLAHDLIQLVLPSHGVHPTCRVWHVWGAPLNVHVLPWYQLLRDLLQASLSIVLDGWCMVAAYVASGCFTFPGCFTFWATQHFLKRSAIRASLWGLRFKTCRINMYAGHFLHLPASIDWALRNILSISCTDVAWWCASGPRQFAHGRRTAHLCIAVFQVSKSLSSYHLEVSGCLLLEFRRFHRCVPSVYSNVASERVFVRLRLLQIMARMSLLKVSTLGCHHLSSSPWESHTLLPCLGLPLLQPLRIPTPRLDLMTSTSKTSKLVIQVHCFYSICCRSSLLSVRQKHLDHIQSHKLPSSPSQVSSWGPGDVQVSRNRQLMIENKMTSTISRLTSGFSPCRWFIRENSDITRISISKRGN